MPKIKLNFTHTHAGVVYPAGHVIDVDGHTAHWIIKNGVGKIVNDSQAVQETAAGAADILETKPKRKAKE